MEATKDEQQCQTYTQVEAWCHSRIASGHPMLFSRPLFHSELVSASTQYQMNYEAIHSLFRNAHVAHMKKNSHLVKAKMTRHIQSYLNGTSILYIAEKCNYPPSMMARLIVENVAMLPRSNNNGGSIKSHTLSGVQRKFITEAIRHPEKNLGFPSSSVSPEYLFSENKGKYGQRQQNNDGATESSCIPLSRLALEVKEAVAADPMYGKYRTCTVPFNL